MIQDIILSWAGSLLFGTLVGALVGGGGAMLLFFILSKCGAWKHPRLAGMWNVASLWIVGIFFLCIGLLSGALWGFSRAAEEKLLAAKIPDTAALKESFAPVSTAASQWIGTALVMAQNPEWMKIFNETKQLPEAATAAISAFENGTQQIDISQLNSALDAFSNQGMEQLFPMIEARWLAANSELTSSPMYDQFRPYVSEMLMGTLNMTEGAGAQQSWLVGSLNQAAQLDDNFNLSVAELGSAIQNDGFQNLFCKPLAALLAAQRWFFCVLLVALLAIPPAGFYILRRVFPHQATS